MTSTHNRPTICATCNRALDIITSGEGVTYSHTIHDPADHPAMPIEAPPGWAGGRCDFCSAEHPRFVLPARDFMMAEVRGLPAELTGWHASGGDWAACDMCALLIQADRWTELERRSAAGFEKIHGFPPPEQARTATRAVHRLLRKNISGALKPIDKGGN